MSTNLQSPPLEEAPRNRPRREIPTHPDSVPLAIDDLTVAYHTKPVLWDIDLDIPEGKLVGIVGPNGAGKSTLIKACLDLIPKVSGRVMVYGKPYTDQRPLVGYVPQRESVDWDYPISALDVVTMGTYGKIGLFKPVRKHHRSLAMQALEHVGIGHLAKRQISQLSGGQQQRVAIARAFANQPAIILADEPTANLDLKTGEEIIDLMKEMNEERGVTVICSTHDHKMLDISDRIIWMRDGKLEKIARRDEVDIEINTMKEFH